MKIRPVGAKILVRVIEDNKEAVVGGIVIRSQGRRDKRREGVIQAVGNFYKGDLTPGMTVLMKPFLGTELRLNGELLVFCKETELEAEVL